MFNNKGKNSAFVKLIIPYACVLLVPILVWFTSNAYIKHNNEKKWILFSENNFRNSVNVVESKLENLENLTYGISQNSSLNAFFSSKKPSFEETLNVRQILSSYQPQIDEIELLYIYSNSSNMVVTSTADYKKPEEFFMYEQPLLGFSAETWAEKVHNGSWANGFSFLKLHNNTQKGYEEIFSYARKVPVEYISKNDGLIGVRLNKDTLLQSFDTLLKEGGGELYVFNLRNELIMSTGENFKEYAGIQSGDGNRTKISLDGENFYRLSYGGDKSQWRYEVFIAGDYILKEASFINVILNLINIITLILGLLLCVYFTYGRNKSYVQIINMLGIKDEFYPWKFKFNEFEFWKPHLGNIISENRKNKENAEELTEIGQYKALHMLLSGFKGNNEDAYEIAESNGIEFQYQKFMVIVLEGSAIYNIERINNRKLFVKQLLKKYIDEDIYLYVENLKSIAVIVNFDMDTEEMFLKLKEQIAKINLEVFYKSGFDAIWGISEESLTLSEVCNLYRQALDVVNYKKLTDLTDVLFYRELPDETIMYDYPIELENRFIQAISAGKDEDAFKIVDIIYSNNFEKRSLSAEKITELFSEILSTMYKVKQMNFKEGYLFDCKLDDFTVKRFFEYIKDFIYTLCEDVKLYDEKDSKEMFREILMYINKNYHMSGLSLNSLKEEFGFSSISYISRSFKNFANENFSSYLEKIRMEKACELLIQGEHVKDICEKVGYISDTAFRRAFKKRMGVSPTDFIKKRL